MIAIEGIKVYAYHGCFEEERKIGGNYIVDVYIQTNFTDAANSDRLEDTVDYLEVYTIVKMEMVISSKLVEHVATRISDAIKRKCNSVDNLIVKVTKLNPPVNGNIEKVSVTV